MRLRLKHYKKARAVAGVAFALVATNLDMDPTPSHARALDQQHEAFDITFRLEPVVDINLHASSQGVAWSPDNTLLACLHAFGNGFEVRSSNGTLLRDYNRKAMSTDPGIGFTDATHLLTPSDDADESSEMFKVWDLINGRATKVFPGPFPGGGPALNRAKSISISKTSAFAAIANYYGSSRPQIVVIESPRTGGREELSIRNIIGSLDGVASLALSSDGKTVAFGTVLGRIVLFDLLQHKILHEIIAYGPDPLLSITAIAFNNDGTFIAGGRSAPSSITGDHANDEGAEDGLGIWVVKTGRMVRKYNTKNQSIRQILWAPGRDVAAAVTDTGELLFANPASSKSFWPSGLASVLSAAFSSNGEKFAVVSGTTLKIFRLQ